MGPLTVIKTLGVLPHSFYDSHAQHTAGGLACHGRQARTLDLRHIFRRQMRVAPRIRDCKSRPPRGVLSIECHFQLSAVVRCKVQLRRDGTRETANMLKFHRGD